MARGYGFAQNSAKPRNCTGHGYLFETYLPQGHGLNTAYWGPQMYVSRLLHGISLPVLMGAIITGFVLCTSLVLFSITQSELRNGEVKQAISRQERAIKSAAIQLAQKYPGIELVWSGDDKLQRIVVDELPDVKDHGFVDQVSRVTEALTTVFSYSETENDFIRVSTTVKRDDGSRATGTKLRKNSAAFGPVSQGKAFHGEAAILGISYYTAYQPIFDRSGKVSGILFSGVIKSSITQLADSIADRIMRSSAMLTIVLAVLGFFLARWLIHPLTQFAAMVEKAQFSDGSCKIPFTERRNELGLIARAFEHFRNSIVERSQQLSILQKQSADFSGARTGAAPPIRESRTAVRKERRRRYRRLGRANGSAQGFGGNADGSRRDLDLRGGQRGQRLGPRGG